MELTGCSADLESEITTVCRKREEVSHGCLFVEIGQAAETAKEAVRHGAAAVLTQWPQNELPCVGVANVRQAEALICANLFDRPAEHLRLVGVTGTNGKTTVSHMLRQMLLAHGRHAGLIGTNHNLIGARELPATRTTPGPLELHALLAQMAEAGEQDAVLEVSSHALAQDRTYGCRFAAAIFTNLTRDHLDYHGTEEAYFSAKAGLFDQCEIGVVNLDDPWAERLLSRMCATPLTFAATRRDADVRAENIRLSADGCGFTLLAGGGAWQMNCPIPGRFSVENALAACTAALALGVTPKEMQAALLHLPGVKGRMEPVANDRGMTVLIDYAHTPDGLQKVLTATRQICRGRLIVLFGCGGDRDRGKRPQMGAVAQQLADAVVLTDDNPRTEEPKQIIADILDGMGGGAPCYVVPNRKKAIYAALSMAKEQDVVLLCGKGHETEQILRDRTVPFDEREIIAEYFKKQ